MNPPGSFDVRSDENGIYLFCPNCGDLVDVDLEWPSINNLTEFAAAHTCDQAPT